MTKRIVSGVFLLIALGALGLILAGALTSGEQLIVRFLTAIIVAALGLYVISDLRLQADDNAVATTGTRSMPAASRAGATGAPPPNSTAAFMATVTGRRSSSTSSSTASLPTTAWVGDDRTHDDPADPADPADLDRETAAASGESGATAIAGFMVDTGIDKDAVGGRRPLIAVRDGDTTPASPYDDFAADVTPLWPLTPDGQVVTGCDENETAEVDGLVAIFAKRSEQEQLLQEPMAVNGHHRFTGPVGLLDTTDRPSARISAFPTLTPTRMPTRGDDGGVQLEEAPSSRGGFPGEGDDGREGGSYGEMVDVHAAEDQGEEPEGDDADVVEGEAEITAVVDVIEVVADATSAAADTPVAAPAPTRVRAAVAHDYTSMPIAPIIDLRFDTINEQLGLDIETAIRSGELDVIASLMEQGVLSSEGPLSDRDVRTMVYVAFTSTELRKLLLAGGVPDGANPYDLGEIEIFRRQFPAAASVGAGEQIDLRQEPRAGVDSDSDSDVDADVEV